MVLPLALANSLLAARVTEVAREPVSLPGLGKLAPALAGLTVRPLTVVLKPAGEGRVGLAVRLALERGNEQLMKLAFALDLRPRLGRDSDSQYLEVRIAPESIRGVRPRLSEGAVDRLTTAIDARLPPLLRAVVPKFVIAVTAQRVVDALAADALLLLRGPLLQRLAERTALRVRLPAVPIAAVRLRWAEAAMIVDLTTQLAVTQGLPAEPRPSPHSRMLIAFSAAAVAASANWAMARGLLPSRYDRDFKPSPRGRYRPLFAWQSGPRPLKVHIFALERRCVHVKIGASVRLQLSEDRERISAKVLEREVETVEGSWLAKLGLWVDSMASQAVQDSRQRATQMRLIVGGHARVARVESVELDQAALRFVVAVELPGQR